MYKINFSEKQPIDQDFTWLKIGLLSCSPQLIRYFVFKQVTDVLVSPKYEDGETTEEEDSDDTVYECPGLGATKGMEVRNPFFMDGRGPEIQPPSSKLANKKPISQYTDLFHHQEIVGLN